MLASGSPRRREIIQALDLKVAFAETGGDEGPVRSGEDPTGYVKRLSHQKAVGASSDFYDALVIGADTAVVVDGETLGKPSDESDALRMIHRLLGRDHHVLTGVTLLDTASGVTLSQATSTRVTLRNHSDAEVAAYMASGSPMDKAGAYAIQEAPFNAGKAVDGCYLNAVGLPLCEVADMLKEMGMPPGLRPGSWLPSECRDCPLTRIKEAASQ